jgi:replicative superfamily II helicase
VIDEYQMIGDPDRGLNYELAIALAPPRTQLLLLSGSVGNPQDIVKWLRRLSRQAELIRTDHRPVPLEEVFANSLSYHVPSEVRGYWPRFCAKALAENLGPILIFAPRRAGAESMAAELARYLPNPQPLTLSQEQKQIVGEHLARARNRVSSCGIAQITPIAGCFAMPCSPFAVRHSARFTRSRPSRYL